MPSRSRKSPGVRLNDKLRIGIHLGDVSVDKSDTVYPPDSEKALEKLKAMGELDNTLIVVSGDHGAAGFPRGKCNLHDFGVAVPLAARMGAGNGGRIVDDFVNLMDLAPAFLEAGNEATLEIMTGRSFMGVIKSKDSGQVDPKRTWIITGRERHVFTARTDYLPYPQRALRTKDYPYIINFKPDRWPIGNPYGIEGDRIPTYEKLRDDIHATFKDMDANPTKAWLVTNGKKPEWGKHYELAFGKRPKEKLYILASDPDQINNVALKSEYESIRKKLHDQLMAELKRTGDPRVMGDGSTFDKLPYSRR